MALPTSRGLFRSLLRARSVAFKGDPTALSAARVEIRKHFDVRPRDRPPPSSLHTARRSPSLTRPPPSVPPPAGVQAPRPRGRAGEDQGGRRGGELHPPARRAGGGQRARQLRDANRGPARGRRVRGARGWRMRGRGWKESMSPSQFVVAPRRVTSPRSQRFLLKTRQRRFRPKRAPETRGCSSPRTRSPPRRRRRTTP